MVIELYRFCDQKSESEVKLEDSQKLFELLMIEISI